MRKLRKMLTVGISAAAAMTLMMALGTTANACHFFFAQPREPKSIEKFRK